MSRAKVYGLLMALAMLFMACLCACSAQPHSAAETAPQTIVVGIDVFDPYSYLDRNGQFAGIDVELATEAFSRLGYTPEFRTISWPDKDNLLRYPGRRRTPYWSEATWTASGAASP